MFWKNDAFHFLVCVTGPVKAREIMIFYSEQLIKFYSVFTYMYV